MKKRILFVDDQVNVLEGLRRMLHGLRHEWDMEFALGSQPALERLSAASFDVVVADMRMPGMDGASLLTEVMRRFPQTVRIVLSGQSEQTAILRSIGPAHQYLSKPCDPDTLKTTIVRACALRDRLADESLKQLVSKVTTLPSLPAVYSQLVRELESPDASIRRVADLIQHDVAMTAKLLQLVNSSFFGLPRHVESPAQAAMLLGLNLLRPLVLSAGVFSRFDDTRLKGYSLEALMDHSLRVSVAAQKIALEFRRQKDLGDQAMMAGLVHDVGQIVLAVNLPDKYAHTLDLAHDRQIPLYDAECESLNAHHADVGAYLLGLWGFPDPIVEAVAFHHEPGRCVHRVFSPLTAVHVANVLVNELEPTDQITYSRWIDEQYLEEVGVLDRLDAWRELAHAGVLSRS
jgi:HD-like signal output (HDOD) protein